MNQIRKITAGPDYKDGMHFELGKEVFGGHKITDIIHNNDNIEIYITKDGEQKIWKTISANYQHIIEYDLNY